MGKDIHADIMELFNIKEDSNDDSNDYSTTSDADSLVDFDKKVDNLNDDIEDFFKDTKVISLSKTIDDRGDSLKEIIIDEVDRVKESRVDIDSIFSSNDEGNENKDIESDSKEDSYTVFDSDTLEDDVSLKSPEKTNDKCQSAESPHKVVSLKAPDNQEQLGATGQVGQEGKETVESNKSNNNHISGADQTGWILNAPTDKYRNFYAKKRSALQTLLPGGMVPFAKYTDELVNARVDLDLRTYNSQEIYERMKEVQGWKWRVQEIIMHVNSQYYMWDRVIDLFHGVLARCEYDKPAVKQEGVNYEHMRDMEYYYQQLRSLHSSANLVLKNLESAWETLNRQVTISLNNKEPERFSNSSISSKNSLPSSDNLDSLVGFDEIDEGVKVEPRKRGPVEVDFS